MLRKSAIGFLALALCVARAINSQDNDASEISPQFSTQPTNYTILQGENVTIECVIEGLSEEAMILWLGNQSGDTTTIALNGRVGKNADRYSVTEDRAAGKLYFTIKSAVVADEGSFTCEVFGTGLSQQHRLTVNIPPTVSMTPPGFMAVNLGEPIILTCEAQGKPKPTVSWMKTGGNLPDGRPSYDGKTLEIMESTVDDAGEYICAADNGVLSPATAFIEVLVEYEPSVEVGESLMYTEVGPSAVLSIVCNFDSVPVVEVIWKHDQSRINFSQEPRLSESHMDGRYVMQISGVQREDVGVYECVGGNSKGQAIGTITVRAEPHGLEILGDGDGSYSDQYSLDWAVNSHNQLIEFDLKLQEVNDTHNSTWEANVVPAPRHHDFNHKQHYVIKALKPSTVYKVQLRAKNNIGYSEWVDFEFSTNEAGNTAPPIPLSTPQQPQPDTKLSTQNTNDSESYTFVVYPAESQDGSNINRATGISLVFSQLVVVVMSAFLLL